MGKVDEVKKIPIGGRAWAYQVFYDENGVQGAVRFYDGEDGGFVTEFESVDDMKRYLYHADVDAVNSELEKILKFRKKCDAFLAPEKRSWEGAPTAVTQAEKEETRSVFTQRIRMLKGDMTNWEFGRVLGLNGATIYSLVAGAKSVPSYTLNRIADVCGVSVDWLLGRE